MWTGELKVRSQVGRARPTSAPAAGRAFQAARCRNLDQNREVGARRPDPDGAAGRPGRARGCLCTGRAGPAPPPPGPPLGSRAIGLPAFRLPGRRAVGPSGSPALGLPGHLLPLQAWGRGEVVRSTGLGRQRAQPPARPPGCPAGRVPGAQFQPQPPFQSVLLLNLGGF